MPSVKGCQSCRRRHDKCVLRSDRSTCDSCNVGERLCVFDNKFRFKAVSHVDTISQGHKTRTDLAYDSDQPWVPTGRVLDVILENGIGPALDDTADSVAQNGPRIAGQEEPASATNLSLPSPSTALPFARPALDHNSANWPQTDATSPDLYSPSRYHWLSPGDGQASQLTDLAWCQPGASSFFPHDAHGARHDLSRDVEDLVSLSRHATNETNASPYTDAVPNSCRGTERASLSHREAVLVQHFIQKIAPWIDCCDSNLAFTREVPRRALGAPMLLRAVLAASAQHIHLTTHCGAEEAANYHGQCLELLINSLSKPSLSYNDNLLATIVCMRIYEELDDSCDEVYHLQGVRKLLNHIPSFAHTGGLAEAASWQALRQDIYVALHDQAAPSFDLEPYRLSRVFDLRDYDAHANVIVLTFARILQAIYPLPKDDDRDSIALLQQEVESWHAQSLLVFEPLYSQAEPGIDQPFPIICLTCPAQVVALQYYYASKALLLEHRPHESNLPGFEAVKVRRGINRSIVASVTAIIGIAQSNTWCENSFFTAHHLLRICGYHIRDSTQRKCSLEFLRHVQKVMGYRTESTIALLHSQWADLDESICG